MAAILTQIQKNSNHLFSKSKYIIMMKNYENLKEKNQAENSNTKRKKG